MAWPKGKKRPDAFMPKITDIIIPQAEIKSYGHSAPDEILRAMKDCIPRRYRYDVDTRIIEKGTKVSEIEILVKIHF